MAIPWLLCSVNVAVLAGSLLHAPQHSNELSHPVGFEESFGENDKDPITNFRLMNPMDGALETLPLTFRAEIGVNSIKSYKLHYGDKLLCVDIQGEWSGRRCSAMMDPRVVVDAIPTGNYTARAFISDAEDGAVRYFQTTDTSFSIVSEDAVAVHVAAAMGTRYEMTAKPQEQGLLEWAGERQEFLEHVMQSIQDHMSCPTLQGNGSDFRLVVGVKTAVVENFVYRQTIRETWASRDVLPRDVKVLFIGCEPVFDEDSSDAEQHQILNAIALEKHTYGDLLTDELHCRDSYADLANKVKAFLRFAAQTFPQTPFVMIADDDIYLRADRLADELRKEGQAQRLYIGQVWDNILGRSQRPVREAGERYYVSEDSYPLSSYPPFAFGPHYVLSMDCVQFIAKNSNRLQGLGAVDDVSAALWLLTMQVHVEHTPAFSSLRIGECKNGMISLADMSAFGLRSIHMNLVEERVLCDAFDRVTWQKADHTPDSPLSTLIDRELPFSIQMYVHDMKTSKYLQVTSIVSFPNEAGVKVSYFPSSETFASYSQRLCGETRQMMERAGQSGSTCYQLILETKWQLQREFQRVVDSGMINRAYLEVWRHNLFVADVDAEPLIVAYSSEAAYSLVVLECLFAAIFENDTHPILVISELMLREQFNSNADVFVFSVLDSACEPMSKPGCAKHYLHNYSPQAESSSRRTKILMISGETYPTDGLDEQVFLLSTISGISRKAYAYLSVASGSFGERLDHPPTALLSPTTVAFSQKEVGERRFCAYLYARCDRPLREYMFDLLNSMEPVDALGICAGSSRLPDESYADSRYSTWYNDDAVSTFKPYKFTIAFENSGNPGYVTEKMVNPFLAGSIPIYLGNSTTVSELFNPDSFIDCGRFEKLRDCAS